MGAMSRRKGKVGEREWAALLREEGFEARRGQQYAGGGDSPDVVSDDLPRIHFEVKRCQRLDLYGALLQAARDAREGGNDSLPVVAHRRNREAWMVTMAAADWLRLVRESEWVG